MATDAPCYPAISPVQAAVCALIKDIIAAHETRRRERDVARERATSERFAPPSANDEPVR